MQSFLVIEMALMLMLVAKLDIRNIEQELGASPFDTPPPIERSETRRKFTAPSPGSALPHSLADSPTYSRGILMKRLFLWFLRMSRPRRPIGQRDAPAAQECLIGARF